MCSSMNDSSRSTSSTVCAEGSKFMFSRGALGPTRQQTNASGQDPGRVDGTPTSGGFSRKVGLVGTQCELLVAAAGRHVARARARASARIYGLRDPLSRGAPACRQKMRENSTIKWRNIGCLWSNDGQVRLGCRRSHTVNSFTVDQGEQMTTHGSYSKRTSNRHVSRYAVALLVASAMFAAACGSDKNAAPGTAAS